MTRNEPGTAPHTSGGRRRLLQPRAIGWVVAAAVVVAAALDTHVEKISDTVAPEAFNPAEFAAAQFDPVIVPGIRDSAVDLLTLLAAIAADEQNAKDTYGNSSLKYNAYSYPITVTAVVADVVDGDLLLAVEGVPTDMTVTLQLESLRGTALRDVTGTIDLNQFLNQLEYNDVAIELNKLAKAEVIDPFLAANSVSDLSGKTLVITGTYLKDSATNIAIVPISIEVES